MGTGSPRFVFAGQGPMGAAALHALASSHPPAGVLTPELPGRAGPVANVAATWGLPLHRVGRIGSQPVTDLPELFADLEVALACCWGERLSPAALAAPVHGWLNLHPSHLPSWRGADPVAWQLLTAPSEVGCSVHRMAEEVDAGAVLASDSVPVGADDDRGTVEHRAGARLGAVAAGVLDDLARGRTVAVRAQRDEEATWCPPPGTTVLVDPRRMRASAGCRVARAFSPHPGVAIVALGEDRRFALPELGPPLSAGEHPGSVAEIGQDRAAVAFGDRWVRGQVWPADDGSP